MAKPDPQTYSNHIRYDPLFHYFLLPVAAITIGVCVYNAIRHANIVSVWMVVVSLAFAVLVVKARTYALKAQDRVIRLEERLRLSTLLDEPWRARIAELTEGQLIALRFAPDEEVPALVQKTLASTLAPGAIKKEIRNWRPDYFRI